MEVEWGVLETVLAADEAVAREAFTAPPRRTERGDVERALAEADVVVEATYRTQTVLHNSLETHQALCEWQGDTLHVYISTQFIWGIREEVADTLGLPQDKVRVVCEFMGGGFGSKNGPDEYTFVAAELAKRTGRPVRCALSRREENVVGGNRNATRQRVTAAARADGTLTALAQLPGNVVDGGNVIGIESVPHSQAACHQTRHQRRNPERTQRQQRGRRQQADQGYGQDDCL